MLPYNSETLKAQGAFFTATEIFGQDQLWNSIFSQFLQEYDEISSFLKNTYAQVNNIILTGAGTSAFIGLSLSGSLFRHTGIITLPVATTDILSYPLDYFSKQHATLVVSFARSGNSPESCAALELADKFSKKCFHLIITCDASGALAKYETCNPKYTFILPEQANDKSLAMTGSYTGMLLTGLLVAHIDQQKNCGNQLSLLSAYAQKMFANAETLKNIAQLNFTRAVFLGSGPLFGTATEAALKLQELTNGKVVCKSDTYLGLRHGPKAVIDEDTLVVYFLSNDPYVYLYEQDLINSMNKGSKLMYSLAIGEYSGKIEAVNAQINLGSKEQAVKEEFLSVCAVLAGQLLGYFKSLQLGLKPDAPSANGAISRVVQGVTIYPFDKQFYQNKKQEK